jgi:hypothetical protein
MPGRTVFRLIVMMFAMMMLIMAYAGIVFGQDGLQKYFNNASLKVKATTDPLQKREILSKSFEKMSKALDKVQGSPLISKQDQAGITLLKSTLQEKQDELTGLNGYERISDEQLDAFSDYVVQDMEQAAQMVTISLVALLLIILIAILVV